MRITEVHLEGATGNFATLSRKRGSRVVNVEIILPGGTYREACTPGHLGAVTTTAELLQERLEGRAGSPAEVERYAQAIRSLQ